MSSKLKIVGPDMPNIPWEDRPGPTPDLLWRYSANPVIPRDLIPSANSIFNSAVVACEDGFAGVFRCDDRRRLQRLHRGRSENGIDWELDNDPIEFACDDEEIGRFAYGYDPRVCWLEDRYYVTWCNGYHGPTIGVGWTKDFETFHQMENAFLPCNRNGVLFPRKINGRYAMLSRPSDQGHTPFGEIFYSESPDLTFWGKHRWVMGPRQNWEATKIGAGPTPIETSEGWLTVYHGVLTSCNGFVYATGVAVLDLDEPWKVRYRGAPHIMTPRTDYECVGDVPNVAFPTAALCDAATGRLAFYYGGADTVVAMAFGTVEELFEHARKHSEV